MSQSMGSFFTVSLVFQPLWRVENVTPSPRNFCQLPTEMCLSYSDWWANPLAFCCCWQFYSFLAALRHLCELLSFIQVVWDLPCRDCNTNRSLRITEVVEAEFCVEGVFNFAPSWYWLVWCLWCLIRYQLGKLPRKPSLCLTEEIACCCKFPFRLEVCNCTANFAPETVARTDSSSSTGLYLYSTISGFQIPAKILYLDFGFMRSTRISGFAMSVGNAMYLEHWCAANIWWNLTGQFWREFEISNLLLR